MASTLVAGASGTQVTGITPTLCSGKGGEGVRSVLVFCCGWSCARGNKVILTVNSYSELFLVTPTGAPKTDGSQLPTNRGLGFSKKRCPATTTKAPRTDLGIKPRRPNHPPSRPMGFPTSARAQAPSTDPPNLTFPTISPIPTYYPTEREFQDPARYIASIQAEASR